MHRNAVSTTVLSAAHAKHADAERREVRRHPLAHRALDGPRGLARAHDGDQGHGARARRVGAARLSETSARTHSGAGGAQQVRAAAAPARSPRARCTRRPGAPRRSGRAAGRRRACAARAGARRRRPRRRAQGRGRRGGAGRRRGGGGALRRIRSAGSWVAGVVVRR